MKGSLFSAKAEYACIAMLELASRHGDPSPVRLRGYRKLRPVTSTQLAKASELIRNSQRPVILAGQGVIQSGAMKELLEFAERMNSPIAPPR